MTGSAERPPRYGAVAFLSSSGRHDVSRGVTHLRRTPAEPRERLAKRREIPDDDGVQPRSIEVLGCYAMLDVVATGSVVPSAASSTSLMKCAPWRATP